MLVSKVAAPNVMSHPTLRKFPALPTPKPRQSSVQVSAAISAYGRIAMSRFMHIPGNPVLYSNTDSLFLQYPLSSELTKEHVSPGGNELGRLKYEGKVTQLVVIGPNQYGYLDAAGQEQAFSGSENLTHALMMQAADSPNSTVLYTKKANLKHDLSIGGVRAGASPRPTPVNIPICQPSKYRNDDIINALGDLNPFAKYEVRPDLLPLRLKAKYLTTGGKT